MYWVRGACLFALLLAGCVESKVSSYTDPAYRAGGRFSSVLVVGANMGLQETDTVESAATQAFAAKGVRAVRSLDIVPPTRQMSEAEMIQAVQATGVQTALLIFATEKGGTTEYVPGAITGTAEPSMVGNTMNLRLHQSPGYTVRHDNARYVAILGDLQKAAVVWQAEVASRSVSPQPHGVGLLFQSATPDEATLSRSMAGEVVNKLIADGLF